MTGETILVVDDESNIRQFCVDILSREGYQAKAARSGEAAIALAREEHFDMLLVDFVMPGISGLDTFKTIRDGEAEIIGILITGYGTLSTAIDAIKLGFKGFLTKPFTHDELLFSVSHAFKQHRLEKQVMIYKESAKLKDDFLALVSHELRTPLSLILSSVNHLYDMREGKADGEEAKMLSMLRKESSRLAKIIADLLTMSELEFRDSEFLRDLVSLQDIVAKTVAGLKSDAEEKGITIRNLVPENLPHFLGARKKIIELMINLLDNAIKFNRKGGLVTVTARQSEDLICLVVEDTGLGITEEQKRNLFDPFYPVGDPMTRKVGGLDLGLPASKKIVEAHGGTIRVESEPEKGSKFVITLPLNR